MILFVAAKLVKKIVTLSTNKRLKKETTNNLFSLEYFLSFGKTFRYLKTE